MGRYDVVSLCNTYRTQAIPTRRAPGRRSGCRPPANVRILEPTAPKWRNWQTRYVQGVVEVLPSGFESPLRHQPPLNGPFLNSETALLLPAGGAGAAMGAATGRTNPTEPGLAQAGRT